MNCPYCNKELKLLYDNTNVFRCSNIQCKKSIGMAGTPEIWEKVAQIAKIRNAGRKYTTKPEIIEKRKEYLAQKYATDPEFKERVLKNGRKWRETNKDKVAERNKKYRETHREYYKEYMKKYNQKKKDNK
jgi:hypothetical protein